MPFGLPASTLFNFFETKTGGQACDFVIESAGSEIIQQHNSGERRESQIASLNVSY